MNLAMNLDISQLQLALNIASDMSDGVVRNASPLWVKRLARTTDVEFEKLVFRRARTKQGSQRLWHMFKANRVGVVGAELFMGIISDEGSRTGHKASVNYIFRSNTEELRNIPSGRLRSYERDGVKGVYGDKRLGIAGKKYSTRTNYRFRDKRNPGKTYRWMSQATDVEFGRKITVKPTSGKWLAVATGDRGVIFAKRRIIDYSNWTGNGYLGFVSLWEQFREKHGAKVEEELKKRVAGNAKNITKRFTKDAQREFSQLNEKLRDSKANFGKTKVNIKFVTPEMSKRQQKVINGILEQ